MTPLASILLPLPIELPDELFEELDCGQNGTQYAAFHYDLRTGCILRENGITIKSVRTIGFSRPSTLHPDLADWCDRNKVQLLAGTHWLIHDYRHRRSYIADPRTAMKCLAEQALPIKGRAQRSKNSVRGSFAPKANEEADMFRHCLALFGGINHVRR